MKGPKEQARRLRDRESARKRALASYYHRKQEGTLPKREKQTAEQRTRYRAARNEKDARLRLKAKERQDREVHEARFAGLAIASASTIHLDTTVWRGPLASNSHQLQKLADEILSNAAAKEERKRLQDEALDRAAQRAAHVADREQKMHDLKNALDDPQGLDWLSITLDDEAREILKGQDDELTVYTPRPPAGACCPHSAEPKGKA